MQHIYIVRHGTTDWVDDKKIQGDTDIPLNQKGRMQAEKAARALAPIQFDAVYCSPLSRTRETAEIICKSRVRQPEIIEDLREMNFGWFEGTHDYTKQPAELHSSIKSDTPLERC
jgi:probable phosphoglycerate mutase